MEKVADRFLLLFKLFRRVRKADFMAGLIFFVSSFLFFYDLLGARYLLTERDLAPYFLPPRFFWVESLKGWDFPLWNPYQFSGHPFLANPQNGLLYPPNGFFFLFPFDIAFNAVIILHFFLAGLFTYLFLRDLKVSSAGSLISGLIFMLSGYLLSVHSLLNILLSVIWTPLIMMFFRRAMINTGIGNEILTALFITLSFLGGGIEIVYGNFFVLLIMMIFSLSAPLSGNPRCVPLLSRDSLAMSLRGSETTEAISQGIDNPEIATLPSVARNDKKGIAPQSPKGRWGGFGVILIRFKSFLIISILFIILSAVQLIPFLELWMHSIRGQGITYHEATIWSLAPKDFLLFFLPDAYGYFLDMKKYWVTQCWLKTMYTGGLPFILSLIFFLFPHPSPLPEGEGRGRGIGRGRMLFLALMLFSLFLSLGQYNPLYPFVYKYIPFFNGIRYPVKFLYIFILCLAITAGLGFERLVQFSKEREKKGLKHLLILFSLISGSLLLFLVLGHREIEQFLKLGEIDFPQFNHLSVNLYHAKRFFFYLTLFFLLIRVGYEVGWKGWTRILIVFFLIADLFGNMGFYGQEKSTDYFKKTKILEIITSDKSLFRVFSTAKTTSMETPIIFVSNTPFDIIKEKNLPSFNIIYQIRDIWGIDVVRLKRGDDLYKAFTGLPSISSSALPNLYGIKYVVSVTPIKDPRFELVYARLEGLEGNKEDLLKQNTIKLYRNKSSFKRAWLVRNFKVMDSKAILSTMTGEDFRPDREVLLEEEPPHPDPLPRFVERGRGERDRVRGNGEVEFISETNNRLSLKVEAKTESILVLSDTFYPGWKAFVNGKEERILRANYNFRAVPLGRGTHQVEFAYDPISFKLGAAITFMGIAGFFSIRWILRRKDSLKTKGEKS
ncbi:MAG: YfhO family protein [Deltaproteobacteria bacterium]|nr:YfhO family protein [Deltaproteobacteria bacterium]